MSSVRERILQRREIELANGLDSSVLMRKEHFANSNDHGQTICDGQIFENSFNYKTT